MTIFAIIATLAPEAVLKRAKEAFPEHYVLNDEAVLVSGGNSTRDVTEKIGLISSEGKATDLPGAAVVVSVASYFGKASPDVWEWIKNEWEKK